MSDLYLTTSTALLEGLSDPRNREVWEQFDRRYRPVISAFVMRLGVGANDAADVAQETLATFLADYQAGKYDRTRGRLHSWIIGIARHRAYDFFRTRKRHQHELGQSALEGMPREDALERIFDEECRQVVLAEALGRLRTQTRLGDDTIRAFTRHVIDRYPPETVATELGITVDAVYMAKHRCLSKLRTLVAELEQAYELDGS